MSINDMGGGAQHNSPAEVWLEPAEEERSGFKARLLDRLVDYPLLRLLVSHGWFRLVFCLAVALVLAVAAALPKLWPMTPKGFRPAVRISLVDLLQARALAESARRSAAAGAEEEAAFAWQGAVANNPANVEYHREALRQMLRCERLSRRYVGQTVSEVQWLLRLTGTNSLDLELATQFYDRYGAMGELYGLLRPRRDTLTELRAGPYMKAAFQAGDMEEFARAWERSGRRHAQDPELALYHAAYQAGWGPVESAAEGRRRLEEEARKPENWAGAARLQLAVFAKQVDVDRYAEVLNRLEDAGLDRLRDKLGYWSLLKLLGRKALARKLAVECMVLPRYPWDVVQLTGAYLQLELDAQALDLLRRYAPSFGRHGGPWAAALWLAECDLLIAHERWQELLDVAIQMRHNDVLRLEMSGFIAFAEGRGRHGLGHTDQAQVAMKNAAAGEYPTPMVALQAAITMRRLGYPSAARDLLARFEADLRLEARYWKTVIEVADQLKEDSVLLLKAAMQGRQLRSGDLGWDADYSVALMINRQAPAEAAQLTWKLMMNEPKRVEWKVHHALALVMNQRFDEAEALLREVNQLELNDLGVTLYHLGAFEVHFQRKDYARARRDLDRISRRHLFPAQLRWLDKMRSQMPAGVADVGRS
jgi:hypothetical protein